MRKSQDYGKGHVQSVLMLLFLVALPVCGVVLYLI